MDAEHIAPCGMNCALCQAFQGKGIVCPGCGENVTRTSGRKCSIRLCGQKTRFCFTCSQYPCARPRTVHQSACLYCGCTQDP